MKILVLDNWYDCYGIGTIDEKDEFVRLGLLLVNMEHAPIDTLNKWLEAPGEGAFEDECFYSIYKKDNLLTVIPYFPQERIGVQPCVLQTSQLKKLIAEVDAYKKEYKETIVVSRENGKYFVRSFNEFIMAFISTSKEGRLYTTYRFSFSDPEHHLGGLGLLLINKSKLKILELIFNAPYETAFCYESFRFKREGTLLTIAYTHPKSPAYFTSTTLEEKHLIKINEYYENIIKQDIEDFLLIKTEEGYSFMTNHFEEIKVEIETV